jgi:hypothetical protein
LYEDAKSVAKKLGEKENHELLRHITMITRLVIKEQTLEESEKNNIYSQMMD